MQTKQFLQQNRLMLAAGAVVVVIAIGAAILLLTPKRTVEPRTTPAAAVASASSSAHSCAPGATAVRIGKQVALEKGRLAEAVLTVADLPSGWSKVAASKAASTGTSSGFAPLDKLISDVAAVPAHQGVRFTRGTSGPVLEEFVAASTATQAGAIMSRLTGSSQQCTTFQQSGKRVVVSPLAVRVQGDQAGALSMTVTTSSGPAVVNVVATRLGNTVVVAYFAQIGKADAGLFTSVLAKAVGRVTAA